MEFTMERAELGINWIHSWIELGWNGLDWVRIFRELYELDFWTGWDNCDPVFKN